MRKPAPIEREKRSGKQRVVHVKTIPAPVGGWNARDPMARMDPRDALSLINFFPRVADVAGRGGAASHATGIPAPVKALPTYSANAGTTSMFATTNSGIFNVTAAGAVGASVATSTNGYWQFVQMGTSAGQFLLMANGTDLMLRYDGAVWTNPAITGPAVTSDIIHLNIYKRRLFVLEKNVLSFWYLPPDVVAGASVEFFLGPLCPKGGFTMAMGTWSLDAGNGPDDYAVFITSEGELVIFSGTDPGTAADWTLVGVYYVSKPIGRKCFVKMGGDLIVLTEAGAVPLSSILKSTSIERIASLTNKIENAFTEAARSYGAIEGWQPIIYPAQSALIFNIPTALNTTSVQYVMNQITKAWCQFTGWNANCFALLNKELYFGGSTFVAKAWTGTDDLGSNIVLMAQTAYNTFGTMEKKKFQLVKPQLLVDGGIAFTLGMSVDFKPQDPLVQATYNVVTGAVWDTSVWDSSFWAAGLAVVSDWNTVAVYEGVYCALSIRIDTSDLTVQWVCSEYVFEMTEGIL